MKVYAFIGDTTHTMDAEVIEDNTGYHFTFTPEDIKTITENLMHVPGGKQETIHNY